MVISKRQTKRLSAIWAILSVCASLLVRSCAQTQKNKPVNAGKNGMSNEKEITHLEKTLDRRRRWLWRWRRWWRQRCRSSDENVDWKLAQTAEDQNENWIQLYFKMNWIEIDLVCLTVVLLVHAYRLPTLMSINEYFLCVWSKNAFFLMLITFDRGHESNMWSYLCLLFFTSMRGERIQCQNGFASKSRVKIHIHIIYTLKLTQNSSI